MPRMWKITDTNCYQIIGLTCCPKRPSASAWPRELMQTQFIWKRSCRNDSEQSRFTKTHLINGKESFPCEKLMDYPAGLSKIIAMNTVRMIVSRSVVSFVLAT